MFPLLQLLQTPSLLFCNRHCPYSHRPHAIIKSHKGLTVENGNTDAEGRLVLADALSYAQVSEALRVSTV